MGKVVMEVKYGTTRTAFLIGNYAVKIPSFVEWKLFLCGLLANMQEACFWKATLPYKIRLCPVLFTIPGGFLIVMARAEPLSRSKFAMLDHAKFIDAGSWVIPVENKLDSFGTLYGRTVAVDYGS